MLRSSTRRRTRCARSSRRLRRGKTSWKPAGLAVWLSTRSPTLIKEVALVAGPFLRFAFEACRQQFLTHGYPPAGRILPS
ncbi:UNVERIFIED_CONTAM: hypothetical protein Slati_0788400 [Sesamum latifolium]|uniref:Uncharacterized protein n=1 Tax=Sesamum latifolium TaxID=2727402 RepID=A0AAW2XKC1_9LAMI